MTVLGKKQFKYLFIGNKLELNNNKSGCPYGYTNNITTQGICIDAIGIASVLRANNKQGNMRLKLQFVQQIAFSKGVNYLCM